MAKHYLWFSAITSKVTRFTTIKTIHILAFLIATFLTLALMSTGTCFYSSLAIFGTFSLTFIFRAICSTHLCLRYKSLINRLFNVKSIFFKPDMMSNIVKCLNVVIVGKVNTYVFPITWKKQITAWTCCSSVFSCPTPFNSLIMLDIIVRCCLIV